MDERITVEESTISGTYTVKVRIIGIADKEEGIDLAELWCDENNSLMVAESVQYGEATDDEKHMFSVEVISDDYK